MDLHSLLRHAVDGGASDVHLKVGQPPILRHDGALRAAEGWPPLTDRQLEEVLATVTAHDPARRATFDQTGDLDLAYAPPGLPRLRVNGFRQRGAISFAFRVIPSKVPGFSDLGLPEGIEQLADEPRGLVLCTGATGSGKTTTLAAMIGHINATRPCHIVTIEDPIEILHEDRIGHRQPARDRAGHAVLQRGAPPRVAPGPRRDPDRRDARRRDGADRDAGGRVGPPRPLDPAHDGCGRVDQPDRRVLPAREAPADPLDPGGRAPRRDQPAAAAAPRRRPGRRGRGDDQQRPHRRPDPREPRRGDRGRDRGRRRSSRCRPSRRR